MSIRIERLGHLGDGIGPGPVHLPRTLPGELVEPAAPGGRLRILEPSPDRIAPACAHYARCGGCALHHARADFVAAWRQEVVTRALAGQGLGAPFLPQQVSPPGSRRRATFAARRIKGGALVGFHTRGSDQIVAVPDCLVLVPALRDAGPALAALTVLGATRKGALSLAVTAMDNGLDVAVRGGRPADAALAADLSALAAAHGIVRLSWEGEVIAQAERPLIALDGLPVSPPPGAFLQATAQGEAALRAGVGRAIGSARRVVDLFAGCGTFALPLSRGAEVHAAEGDAAQIAALTAGWRAAGGLHRLSAETRDLFRRPLVPLELDRFDAAVIDPPRAGAEAQVAEIAASRLPRVAMVSCNPVTFARDAAVLVAAGFRLDWVQIVDQFRWSAHLELVAALSRDHIRHETNRGP